MKLFLEKINSIHPTIKFTVDWSYSSVNFLDVKVIMKDGKSIRDFYVKPTDTHQYLDFSLCSMLCILIESVLIMPSLIRDVTNESIGYMNRDIVNKLLGKKYQRHEKCQEMNC